MNAPAELAEHAAQLAKRYEFDFGCCPQCVLAAVQETVGGVSDETIKASHGLSGGGGLSGVGLCGSLVGGLLALGAKRGRDRGKFAKGKFIANFRAADELISRFREQFGGTTCRELQERFTGRTYDMWDAEEYKAFTDARGEKCADTAAFVTRMVIEKL